MLCYSHNKHKPYKQKLFATFIIYLCFVCINISIYLTEWHVHTMHIRQNHNLYVDTEGQNSAWYYTLHMQNFSLDPTLQSVNFTLCFQILCSFSTHSTWSHSAHGLLLFSVSLCVHGLTYHMVSLCIG